eukprot:gene4813-5999_t
MSSYKEDLTLDDDKLPETVPRGVEFIPMVEPVEKVSNLVKYTGVAYLSSSFIGATIGGFASIKEIHEQNQKMRLGELPPPPQSIAGAAGAATGTANAAAPTANPYKSKLTIFLNNTGHYGGRIGTKTAATVCTYGVLKKTIYLSTDIEEESIFSSVVAGATTGTLFRARGGPLQALLGMTTGALLGYLIALGGSKHVKYK